MAFPSDVYFQLSGYGRDDDSAVARSDMDKGMAKTRRLTSDVRVQITGKLFFRTLANELAFDDWFYSPSGGGGGAAFFDWTDPRTSVVRQVRFVSRGTHNPASPDFGFSEQACVLEYLREAWTA